MLNCFIVGLGGFIGAVLRYLISIINYNPSDGFPLKTFSINITGSLVIGLIAIASIKYTSFKTELSLFLKVGFCGGFTTFSSFSLETYNLIEQGNYGIALLYTSLSFICGIGAIFIAQILLK